MTIETVVKGVHQSFLRALPDADLIIGARGDPVSLLINSIYFTGDTRDLVKPEIWRTLARHRDVGQVVPIITGDKMWGFPVVGTVPAILQIHIPAAQLEKGRFPRACCGAVVGVDVAAEARLDLGNLGELTHGITEAEAGNSDAAQKYRVSGILARTNGPLDRVVLVDQAALRSEHAKAPRSGERDEEAVFSAIYVKMRNPTAVFLMQQAIRAYPKDALSAILPGVTFQELLDRTGRFEQVLNLISAAVVLMAALTILTSLWASLAGRHREVTILRALGARPSTIIGLLAVEGALMAVVGWFAAVILHCALLATLAEEIHDISGVYIGELSMAQVESVYILIFIAIGGITAGALTGYLLYRQGLKYGLRTM